LIGIVCESTASGPARAGDWFNRIEINDFKGRIGQRAVSYRLYLMLLSLAA